MSQDIAGLPVEDRYPIVPTTSASVTRADSVLNRLFPNPSIRSKGAYSLNSGNTSVALGSSKSHRTHLPINAAPAVLAQSVGAGRTVEVSRLGLSSPVTRDSHELHAQLSYLPPPPPPVRPTQSALDQSDTDLPPPPPPKDDPMPSHRRESAHYQAGPSAQANLPDAFANILIPTTTSPTSTDDLSQHVRPRQLPESLTARHPRSSRTSSYDTTFSEESNPNPLRRSTAPGTRPPAHAFIPQPGPSRSTQRPPSKGAHRMSDPISHASRPPSVFSSHYHHMPVARSPPSGPLADQIPSGHQHL